MSEFLERRDEVAELAFAVLVERHGPMVLGVCRRILRDPHDAEDAFQATFLVLARKGHSIRVEGSLGRWLFGVATRVATRARSDETRRRARERHGLDRLEVAGPDAPQSDIDRAEIQAIIAMEIAGLPARFQAAVLLCDLEGRSYEEAARRLGWPVGTVKSRLSRGRARLRERLTRRGLAPADLSIVTALLPAAPSPILVETTTRAALALIAGRLTTAGVVSASVATLTQGVLRTMILTKIKLAAAAVLLVATGSAALFGQAAAQKAAGVAVGQTPAAAAPKAGAAPASDEPDRPRDARTRLGRRHHPPRRGGHQPDHGRRLRGHRPGRQHLHQGDLLPDLENGVFASAPIELDEIKTRVFGDTAVVTSRIKVQTWSTPYRMTNVYIKRQRRWQCVASHASWVTGGVCPAIGPIADTGRSRNFITHAQDFLRPSSPAAQNCTVCHATTPKGGFPIEPVPARPSGEAKDRPALTSPDVRPASRDDRVTSVRPPVEGRVVLIHGSAGMAVKKGDPLIELFSTDLAAAKAEYEMALSQWQRDKKVYDYKKPLAESNTIPTREFIDVENDETQSRLKLKLARDKLLLSGLTDAEIGKKELGLENARFTLRSPVDGVVIAVGAVLGNFYDRKDVLIQIREPRPQPDRKP